MATTMPDEDALPSSGLLKVRTIIRQPIAAMGLTSLLFFSVILIVRVAMDVFGGDAGDVGPYSGLVTYVILPMLCGASTMFAGVGIWVAWHRCRHTALPPPRWLSWTFSWKVVFGVVIATVTWLSFSVFGTYRAYQYTDSNSFCGMVCHEVMKPEYEAYRQSDHARVHCVECHIGPGADWFVKAKVTGLGQVLAMARGTYKTPIETPIENLRPAQDTCEQCHWPGRFSGAVERVITHYATDNANTPTRFKLLMQVGGENAGPSAPTGVHWHVNSRRKVEYLPVDKDRQDIPYVRVTHEDGKREEFASAKFDRATLDESRLRTMDCLDCHNRPSHVFHSPDRALDEALDHGRIDPRLPGIKRAALALLEKPYRTQAEGEEAIRAGMDAWQREAKFAPDQAESLALARESLLQIFRTNFFPEQGVDYRAFIDNASHLEYKGCERCHDGRHKSPDGQRVITRDCDACHILVGQASGTAEVASMKYGQVEFEHPEDPVAPGKTCSSCHARSKADENE